MSLFCVKRKGWTHFGCMSSSQLPFPSSVLSLSGVTKPYAKHFFLIFQFPLRFKRNLIHMFLIHLHSVHKNCSSIWSHCGPGALKSFQMSLPSWIEIQMLCFVSSKQIWNLKKKSLGHKWESTDGSGTCEGKKSQ